MQHSTANEHWWKINLLYWSLLFGGAFPIDCIKQIPQFNWATPRAKRSSFFVCVSFSLILWLIELVAKYCIQNFPTKTVKTHISNQNGVKYWHSEAHRTGIRHQSKIASGNQHANRLFKLLIHIKLRLSMNYILTECIESANQTASLAYNFIRLNKFKWNLVEILQICYYLIFYQALKLFSVYLFLAYLFSSHMKLWRLA